MTQFNIYSEATNEAIAITKKQIAPVVIYLKDKMFCLEHPLDMPELGTFTPIGYYENGKNISIDC